MIHSSCRQFSARSRSSVAHLIIAPSPSVPHQTGLSTKVNDSPPVHKLLMKFSLLIVATAVVLIFSVTASPAAAGDPARIVPWHAIGNVAIGMSKTRVEYAYGRAARSRAYTVQGGALMVSYDSLGVGSISTTSSRYRTPDGLGVGSHVPLGPCIRVKQTPTCQHKWKGFTYSAGFSAAWFRNESYGKRTIQVQLFTNRGVVTTFALVVLSPQSDPF